MVAASSGSLRALREHPFDLLREMERRAKVGLAGGESDDASVEEWVGIGFRLGTERFIVGRDEVVGLGELAGQQVDEPDAEHGDRRLVGPDPLGDEVEGALARRDLAPVTEEDEPADGEPTADLNIPVELRDYDGDGNDPGTVYHHDGSDYTDDVALYAHTEDLRSDLDGTQSIYYYPVFAFGEGMALLKDAARNGAFEDNTRVLKQGTVK